MVDSHKVVERELKFLITFCSSGKLYLACTTMKAILTSPNFFMNGIDYSSSESEFPRKLYLPARQVKNAVTSSIIKSSTPGLLPGHYSVYSVCTLFNITWLELEPLNAFLTTLLLLNTTQTSPMKLLKCLYKCHFYINNTGMIILVLLSTNYYVY